MAHQSHVEALIATNVPPEKLIINDVMNVLHQRTIFNQSSNGSAIWDTFSPCYCGGHGPVFLPSLRSSSNTQGQCRMHSSQSLFTIQRYHSRWIDSQGIIVTGYSLGCDRGKPFWLIFLAGRYCTYSWTNVDIQTKRTIVMQTFWAHIVMAKQIRRKIYVIWFFYKKS